MMRDFFIPALIGSLSIVAIISGLITSGGPARGRAEARDDARVSRFYKAASHIRCLATQNENQLPETANPHTECPDHEQLTDPFSGETFEYSVSGPNDFRICATFDLPEDQNRSNSAPVDHETANVCFNFELNP